MTSGRSSRYGSATGMSRIGLESMKYPGKAYISKMARPVATQIGLFVTSFIEKPCKWSKSGLILTPVTNLVTNQTWCAILEMNGAHDDRNRREMAGFALFA